MSFCAFLCHVVYRDSESSIVDIPAAGVFTCRIITYMYMYLISSSHRLVIFLCITQRWSNTLYCFD